MLYPAWDKTFIWDSYSCRNGKGTHKAFKRLEQFSRQVTNNYTKSCWALKLDIRKFFDSIDHKILMNLLETRISDERLLKLLQNIISSFSITDLSTSLHYAQDDRSSKGMPLGNLTSQLFANIYLDPLDKFVKHHLK